MINVVLDIDNVLCHDSKLKPNEANFYLNEGAIISALKTHYVFPGVKEFIKLLFQTKNIKVSFFSSSDHARNKLFVKELLKASLGKHEYKKIKKDVIILSKEDLVSNSKNNPLYDLPSGTQGKDISKVLRNGDLIENAILIDDSATFACFNQSENLMKVPCATRGGFTDLPFLLDSYDKDGYRGIPCYFRTIEEYDSEYEDPDELSENSILFPDEINVLKSKGGYEIEFLNTQAKQCERKALNENNKELISLLNEIHKISCSVKNPKLLSKIYAFVDSNKGQTKVMHLESNRICYVAGLLFKSMEEAKQKNVPITKVLSQWQFQKEINNTFTPIFDKLHSQQHLYFYGLDKLKEVNPNFSIVSPNKYHSYLNLKIDEKLKERLIKLNTPTQWDSKGLF